MTEILVIDSPIDNGAISTTHIEQIVVDRPETHVVAVENDAPPFVLVVTEADSVCIEHTDIHIVAAGQQGPQGIQGIPGPTGGSALQYPAGEALGGHRMVILDDAEQAVYASNQNGTHAIKVLGITLGAVAQGNLATVQTGGELTEPSWAWTLNQPIYLGDNGLLMQTPPSTGFSLIVAFPISPTKVLLRIREPIVLD